jgi:hypothetical protein
MFAQFYLYNLSLLLDEALFEQYKSAGFRSLGMPHLRQMDSARMNFRNLKLTQVFISFWVLPSHACITINASALLLYAN